ncbi:hydroxylamine reductase [Culturomica massiliensis]|jgi:hydroxylamine reductase|uniref:hydroxylamine reductase n=1 Tax=Culturomica massiliensis TaxID=1841857 RepID=UPI000E55954C|nr:MULTISPECIES: hydroxylamine reductase [Odoribacteraceae]RHV91457.1 hydroxylamine reductase [Odoribacter sp. OF09-27XD]
MKENMFCFQCQETAKGTGCTVKGVCGKMSSTSAMMDMLLFSVRGIAIVANTLRNGHRKIDEKINRFIVDALFTTITNANFDDQRIIRLIRKGMELRNELINQARQAGIPLPETDELQWQGTEEEYTAKASQVGVLRETDENLRSLKELTLYGLKGMAAYTEHAMHLGFNDESIHTFIQQALSDMTTQKLTVPELTQLVLETGKYGVSAMALLDKANTQSYGNPEITKVDIGVRSNPGILISGHDLKDLEELLEQTEGTGVDVYTHSEMLPAHYYPAFKKYSHFAGNYGNSWWRQREEFETFNGPIYFTTNCIVPPLPSASYINRMYTGNSTGYPGCKHIQENTDGYKDFSEIIAQAKKCPPPTEIETGHITGGFAHNQVVQLAPQIIEAVRSGAIRKFIVMAGCDGRMKNREYYTEFAEALPKNTVILTAGCAKYRYNKLGLGDINGIPRVLDAGQCNDSYSLALIALKLKEIFGLANVNDLPIAFNIAWYEQKAVIVLLALLSLGFKNIHIGPTLPAFVSPAILNVLAEQFNLGGITDVKQDLQRLHIA